MRRISGLWRSRDGAGCGCERVVSAVKIFPMSTLKKVERALYGPSVMEVTFGAVLSVTLGALLGAMTLIMTPVERVREVPEEAAVGQVFYVEGSRSGGQYLRKRQLLLEGGTAELTLSEADLNAWIAATATPVNEGASGGLLTPQSINFRVAGDRLQIGVPSTLSLFGLVTQEVILQARGGFERRGSRFVYVPEEFKVGGLATERFPGVASFLVGRLLGAQEPPEEMVVAWDALRDVRVVGNSLVLTLP